MTKVVINDEKGLVQEHGTGTRIDSKIVASGDAKFEGAFYSASETITVLASAVQLDSRPVQLVDSADNAHKAKMPLAAGAGQLMIIVNVDAGQDAVIRNNADDGTLATLGEGKIGIFVSSASGDNWSGSQVD